MSTQINLTSTPITHMRPVNSRMIPSTLRKKVFERDGQECQNCGFNENPKILEIVRITSLAAGGSNEEENLVTLCPNCHRLKDQNELTQYLAESVAGNTHFYETFQASMDEIKSLAELASENGATSKALYRMLYAGAVASVETYLCDAFINTVTNDNNLLRKLVETTPSFNEKNYKLTEIYAWQDNIKKEATEYLLGIIYHKIFTVKIMYKAVLDVSFPDSAEDVIRAVMVRHDVVHRNGKSKKGAVVTIGHAEVLSVAELVSGFIGHIDTQLHQKHKKKIKS